MAEKSRIFRILKTGKRRMSEKTLHPESRGRESSRRGGKSVAEEVGVSPEVDADELELAVDDAVNQDKIRFHVAIAEA